MIQGTASEAILVALLAARDKVLKKVGKNSLPKLVAYASDQAHASMLKACQVLKNLLRMCVFGNFYLLIPIFSK